MVEKNNQSSEQEYQRLQQVLSQGPEREYSKQPTEKTSTGKKVIKVVLIILGVAIAIPFLLFLTCLGIVAVSN
ncbi:MAG: hypothetical protein J5594_04270 [Elusimicrobiaceae bacterium]|nr:hypothetical protein [Elusimicrobiaceae bacterium]